MNNEFKRMQELAGINEIKVRNPIPVYDELKVGDKLKVTKDNMPFFMSGDIWEVERIGDAGLLKFVRGQGKARTNMGSSSIKKMLDDGALRYV
jgi:hypothetical protein